MDTQNDDRSSAHNNGINADCYYAALRGNRLHRALGRSERIPFDLPSLVYFLEDQ